MEWTVVSTGVKLKDFIIHVPGMTSPYNTEREKWISSARKKKLSELRSRNDKSVEDFRDNLEKEVVNILEKCQNQVRDFKVIT